LKVVNFTKPFWLISDTHFGHERLAFEFGLRTQFKNIDEHNETIFCNWNEKVSPESNIIFLGDFVVGAFNKYGTAKVLYNALHGRKFMMLGNHDGHLADYIPAFDGPLEVKYLDKRLLLSHEPLWDFDRSKYFAHIFGHIHSNSENEKVDKTCMKNVSVEMVNYAPVFIDDIIQEMERLRLNQK